MAALSTAGNTWPGAEAINPCLLDKLRSDGSVVNRAVMSVSEYEASVLRDLQYLLNEKACSPSTPLIIEEAGPWGRYRRSNVYLADFADAMNSVLRCGLPDLSGIIESDQRAAEVAGLIAEAIKQFEPRLNPDSLRVQALAPGPNEASRFRFRITATLWAFPRPAPLVADVDLKDGHCTVSR